MGAGETSAVNKWTVKKKHVYNVAHRGASKVAPENSIPAFERALALGADGIELDVMKCRSGEVVVFHDERVDRMTDGEGRISRKTLDELKELDISGEFNDTLGRIEIPTLDEVFERFGDSTLLNIEIKSETVGTNGIEADVVDIVNRHGCADTVLISSFNPMSLRRVRRISPELPRALIIAPSQKFYHRRLWLSRLAKPQFVHPELSMVRSATIKKWRARGFAISPWLVNHTVVIKKMAEYGVHSIITDDPAKVSAVLGKRRVT